jgi:hypothetical protein
MIKGDIMKKQKTKIPFYKKYRILTITLVMFLIVLPLIVIPTIYVAHFVNSKDILFSDKSLKAVPLNKQDKFEIDVYLDERKEVLDNDDNFKATNYIFYLDFKSLYTSKIKDINIEVQLSAKNDKYDSESISKSIKNESEKNKFEIPFAYNPKKKILPLVRVKEPTLYLKITFEFEDSSLLKPEPIIIKITPKQYN